MESNLITKADLQELGLLKDMDQATADAFLAHVNDTLKERIGAEVTSFMEDDEVAELMDMQDAQRPAEEIADWLGEIIPHFDEIKQQERTILLGELVESSAELG